MTVIEELETAVVEFDKGRCIQQVNSAAEECLALRRERLLGQSITGIDGIPGSLLDAISDTLADHRTRRLHDCAFPGGLFDCTLRQLGQERLLLECHGLEWSRQQRQIQQVEVQTGLMNLLRRNLGHEIRNPLGGIRGAAQMMAAELAEQELGTLARMIMREVDRIDELIKRFWQPEIHRQDFDIHRSLQEGIELVASEAAGVTFQRDYDPSIPELRGDPAAIRQLVLNLLRNACQSGATQVEVRSRVEHGTALLQDGRGTLVRIDVEDNGDGVPERLRPLLFLPMVTGRREGTGLGLALVQQIAADHDGLVTYEALPEGSRFTLHIPVGNSNQEEALNHD